MNQEEVQQFSRSKLQSTIAVSKMAGEGGAASDAVDDKRNWTSIERALTEVRTLPTLSLCSPTTEVWL